MSEHDDAREHIRGFFNAVDKLQEMEEDINQNLLTILLLYSLPSSYDKFQCVIESRDNLPAPETLKIKIIEENDARKSAQGENSSEAILANSANHGYHKKLGWKEKKPNIEKGEEKSFHFKCHKCRKVGHKASECRAKYDKKAGKASKVEEMGFLITPSSKLALNTEDSLYSGLRSCSRSS